MERPISGTPGSGSAASQNVGPQRAATSVPAAYAGALAERRHGRGRGWTAWLLAAAAVGCVVAALLWVRACRGETLELVGVVERKNIELVAPVLEEIVERPVRIGQTVAAGQVVVKLNAEVAELELQAAQASRAAAEANLAALEQDFARAQGLARAQVTARRDFDAARRARDEAVALLAERSARAAQARKRLKDLTVVSTVDGVVDQLPYEVGERVPAGSVLAVILARENPWVRVWLPARATALLRAGATARVAVEGLGGTFEGRFEDIGRAPEFTPHFALTERERAHLVYESRVVLLGAPADLRPGVPATVSVPLLPATQAPGTR